MIGQLARMVPFFATQCFYWLHSSFPERMIDARVKCAPIACLAFFVASNPSSWRNTNGGRIYPLRILAGLVLCMAGDFLLTYLESKWHFLFGMLAFGTGHLFYVGAFGGERSRVNKGLGTVTAAALLALPIFVPCMLEKETGWLLIPSLVYAAMLALLYWNCVTTLSLGRSLHETVFSICRLMGAIIFSVSDIFLITTMACGSIKDPHFDNNVVMTTYYLAQFLLASSTLEASCNRDE